MNRNSSIVWLILAGFLLLPTAFGRIILDLAGGLIFIIIAIPILLSGAGWIAWRIIQSRMIRCKNCGITILNSTQQCPACGSKVSNNNKSNDTVPASSATIDITPK